MRGAKPIPAFLLTLIAATACVERTANGPPARTSEAIRARTTIEFEHASMLRPDPESVPGFDVYSAPLILVEHDGGVGDEVDAPPVVFERGTVTLRGREYDQLSFFWTEQGLRLTYGSDGFPVIQEVLATPGDLRVVYVMEHLESSARKEFGEPLAGRAFAIEASIEVAPELVVAKILKSGPTPMGPWVMVRSGEVVTLLCRCAPSQTKSIEGVGVYALEEGTVEGRFVDGAWLESALRLPAEF